MSACPSDPQQQPPVLAIPVRRKSDVNVTFDKLQGQLLRSCKPAVRKLARAARGHSDFRNELELRACLGLARIAADLLYCRTLKASRPTPPRPSDDLALRTLRRYFKGA